MDDQRLVDGYEPRFDIDYERDRQGELFVHDIIRLLQTESVEVKTDERAKDTGNVYVEYECLRGGEYVKSGLATTDADAWVFVLEKGDLAVFVSTLMLRELAREAYKKGRLRECVRGSHPTRGVVIPLAELVSAGTHAGRSAAVKRVS